MLYNQNGVACLSGEAVSLKNMNVFRNKYGNAVDMANNTIQKGYSGVKNAISGDFSEYNQPYGKIDCGEGFFLKRIEPQDDYTMKLVCGQISPFFLTEKNSKKQFKTKNIAEKRCSTTGAMNIENVFFIPDFNLNSNTGINLTERDI